MKFSALERLLFVVVFFLTAAICAGFLFGYRYSFDEQRVEQRGVLVLSGKQSRVDILLDGQLRRVSLPYVDTGITIGTHELHVQKPGYIPFQTTFTTDTIEASIVPVELPPQLLTGQKQTFPVEDNDAIGYFGDLGVVQHTSASGTILLHAETPTPQEVYLPTQLRMEERGKLAMTQVSNRQILFSTQQLYYLFSEDQNLWQQIFMNPTEILSVDQSELVSYSPTMGLVRHMNSVTGRAGDVLLENVTEIVQSDIKNADSQTEAALYKQASGKTFRLQSGWFSSPNMQELSSYDELQTTQALLTLSESGSVMVGASTLLPSVDRILYSQDSLYFIQKSGAVFTLSESAGLTFLNRFSSPIIGVYAQPGRLYAYIQTETALYFCEQRTLSYCSQLGTGFASMKRGVDTDKQYLWYYDKDNTLTLVPFFRE